MQSWYTILFVFFNLKIDSQFRQQLSKHALRMCVNVYVCVHVCECMHMGICMCAHTCVHVCVFSLLSPSPYPYAYKDSLKDRLSQEKVQRTGRGLLTYIAPAGLWISPTVHLTVGNTIERGSHKWVGRFKTFQRLFLTTKLMQLPHFNPS